MVVAVLGSIVRKRRSGNRGRTVEPASASGRRSRHTLQGLGRSALDELHVEAQEQHPVAALDQVLDTTVSGGHASITGAQVQVALSMRTARGELCRQFRLTAGDGASDAVACRDGSQWRVLVQSAVNPNQNDSFQTAGAGREDPIDAAIEGLGGVVVLDVAEERALIGADWRVHSAR
mgnify:CR=1 FL=1